MQNETAFSNEIYEIGGVKTNVYVAGAGEPLVWFHGAGGLTPDLPIYKELLKEYKIYLVDHPGFGYSERPDWLVDFNDYNYFYRDFLDYFSLEKVNIAGHSLGGRIAVEFAISHPNRVNKLVLLCAAGLYLDGVEKPDTFMMSPDDRKKIIFFDENYTEQLLNKKQTDQEQENSAKNLVTLARLNWERDFNPKFPRLLSYIKAPACIIWGANDQVIPLEHGQAYKNYIEASVLHVLEKCGHMPHVEQEEQCVKIMKEFINN